MKPLSATEVDTARGCMRKWGWKYIAGIRPPPHPSAVKGSALHAIAEKYLRDAAQPERQEEISALFMEGLPHLPAPRTGLVEASFSLDLDGLPFAGVMDWFGWSDHLPGAPHGMIAVLDHKTSKDPRRYGMLSKAQHLNNPQSLIYARVPDRDVLLRWVYYHTSGRPKATAVTVELTRSQIRTGLENIVLPLAERVYRIREKGLRDVLDLSPNPDECDAYGGCPFRARCNLKPSDFLGAMFGEKTMSSVNPFAMPPSAPVAAAPTPAPVAAPAPSAGSLMAKLPPPPSAVATSINGPAATPSPVSTGQAVVVKAADEKILAAFRAAAHAFLTALS
jgi:RecB family exonuclease